MEYRQRCKDTIWHPTWWWMPVCTTQGLCVILTLHQSRTHPIKIGCIRDLGGKCRDNASSASWTECAHPLPEPRMRKASAPEWQPAPTAHLHSGLTGVQHMRSGGARWRPDGMNPSKWPAMEKPPWIAKSGQLFVLGILDVGFGGPNTTSTIKRERRKILVK